MALVAIACSRYVTSGPVGGGAMGIYERQRHLVAAGVWGEPFRPDADAVALPLPRPLAAVAPTVTVATTPAPLDVVEAEEVKFGKRLLQAQQDDVAPPVEEEAPPPPSDSFGHDDDARPRDKIQRRLAQNREAARKSRLRKKVSSVSAKSQHSSRAKQIFSRWPAPWASSPTSSTSWTRRTMQTPRQAALGLLALADYGQRLRALSSLWAARPREPAYA